MAEVFAPDIKEVFSKCPVCGEEPNRTSYRWELSCEKHGLFSIARTTITSDESELNTIMIKWNY
jgi:hypothetical protein